MKLSTRQFGSLYRAFLRKDERLDGRVFIAVRTTGIYCMLSCRARTPRPENVTFYRSRAEVERDGFRPCRKCRPEVHGGRRALEQATLQGWLSRLAEEDSSVAEVAREHGTSPSGMYRKFRRTLGRSPREARGEVRLARACELLADRKKRILDVAFEAGFSSVATVYRWFQRSTGLTPTTYRRRAGRGRVRVKAA
jgi:AraC family transcriptional regulator of adaptative response / methylphosphotriester-DNA alkyltransferase methyltransferase